MTEHSHHTHSHLRIFHKLGMSLSIICTVHCLAMPFVMALLPMAGAIFHSLWVEVALLGGSMLLAGYNFTRDFRKGQTNAVPLFLLAAGFVLTAAAFVVGDNHLLSILGGLFIFSGYALNWHAGRKYAACQH